MPARQDDVISEFTQLKLVIRPRKVEQFAFFGLQLSVVLLNYWPQKGAITFLSFSRRNCTGNCGNLVFIFARTDRSHCISHDTKAKAMLSGVVLLPFGCLVRFNCALNSFKTSAVYGVCN